MSDRKITKEEFDRIASKGDNSKPIEELFEIKCKKCNCKGCVELFGAVQNESGYYGESYSHGQSVIKCHNCGNAKAVNLDNDDDLEELE